MSETKVIDGKKFASALSAKIKSETRKLYNKHKIVPGLAVVLVGEDPASQVYVRRKGEQTKELGMQSFEHKLSKSVKETELLKLVRQLNEDHSVNGILVQLPLPKHIDEKEVLKAISPEKDVDGFHTTNVGRLWTGSESLTPCTPFGCLLLLKGCLGSLVGLNATIIGRSNIVGKPIAALLLAENCTVTIAHSKTENLEQKCKNADILIAAVGRPNMVKSSWVKKGATVIDVGINRIAAPERGKGKTKIVGDVDFNDCYPIAGQITPVPGGVGPMTIACLLRNTLVATYRQANLAPPAI